MMNFLRFASDESNIFIPILIFIFALLIGALAGFITGWKAGVFFLLWNIIFLVPSVIFLDKIGSLVSNFINVEQINMDYVVSKYGGFFILVVILFTANSMAFSAYWVFRPRLKKKIKLNKKDGKSNLKGRIIGSGLGVITIFPITVFFVEASTILMPSSGFTKMNNSLASILSFGSQKSLSNKEKEDLKHILVDTKEETLNKVGDILEGKGSRVSNLSNDDYNNIEKLLNNDLLLSAIDVDSTKSILEKNNISLKDTVKTLNSDISNKFKVTLNSYEKIKDLLQKIDPNLSDSEIEKYLNHLLVIV
ncbi:MAG: hypothetical protein HRT99_00615 [Mycoplasmatales bacterium]|nr:hypothetical protein [Mycoplasmatales bacterium]